MNKKVIAKISASAVAAMPLFAFAQTIEGVLLTVSKLLNSVIPIIMVFATVVFLWGVVNYITAAGDEKKAGTAKNYIQMGLIGLFFMVAVWGVVQIFVRTF